MLLSAQRGKCAYALREAGVPPEFAILLAQNVTGGSYYRGHEKDGSPAEWMWCAFTWDNTPERHWYWSDMQGAMYDEEVNR